MGTSQNSITGHPSEPHIKTEAKSHMKKDSVRGGDLNKDLASSLRESFQHSSCDQTLQEINKPRRKVVKRSRTQNQNVQSADQRDFQDSYATDDGFGNRLTPTIPDDPYENLNVAIGEQVIIEHTREVGVGRDSKSPLDQENSEHSQRANSQPKQKGNAVSTQIREIITHSKQVDSVRWALDEIIKSGGH